MLLGHVNRPVKNCSIADIGPVALLRERAALCRGGDDGRLELLLVRRLPRPAAAAHVGGVDARVHVAGRFQAVERLPPKPAQILRQGRRIESDRIQLFSAAPLQISRSSTGSPDSCAKVAGPRIQHFVQGHGHVYIT